MATKQNETWGKITDEEFQRVAQRIGVWRVSDDAHWRDATRDAFRHFSLGSGDPNPLYTSDEYAAKTRWGVIAHPMFACTYARSQGFRGAPTGGFPGVHSIACSEADYYYRPIRVGDRLQLKNSLWDMRIVPSKTAGKMVDMIRQCSLVDLDRGEVVARWYALVKRWERKAARERRVEQIDEMGDRGYKGWQRWVFTDEEIKIIRNDYEKMERRGATTRYWEDVQLGEELPYIIIGPYTARELVAFYMGAGAGFIMASSVLWNYFREHPGLNVPDPATNTPDVPERTHFEAEHAKFAGAPDMFDVWLQRLSWQASMVSNWMGDEALLRELSCVTWKFNMYGDVTWINGQVVEKYQKGKENLVKISLVLDNQRYRHAWGHAVVSLPSRERGPVVVPQLPHDPSNEPYAPLSEEVREILMAKDPGLPFGSHFNRQG
ncbi:MaoC family dehydratase N-terminal domain-containing protein [Chloroflexota bacterium]